MFVKAREKTFNITCIQSSLLTSENSIIQWNPVCLLERGAYGNFAVLISTYDNDDCLQKILQKCSSHSCAACIIVNPDEKSELLTTTIDLTQYNIPIYVVKKTDGRRIHELCLSERNVHVKTEESSELQKQHNSLFSKLGKRLTRQTKLPDQLINYIGESWQSDISCEQAKDIFVQVILYLQKYDDEGWRNNYNYNMTDVITLLFSDEVFMNSFSVTLPVYVYILAHIVSNKEVYICHDGNNAVDRVMQKCGELIKLNPQKVMETIAQYRPDKISGLLKTRWRNVGNSFLDLLNHWTLTKPELPCDFFSKAIPMIVIAQTILKEAGGLRSELQKQWGTHLLKYADKVNYRLGISVPSHIQWLEEGLQFQVIIRSTSDCYLMPKHLKELVNSGRRVCTLLEARNVLLTLPKQLEYKWKTDFLADFIMPLRTSYHDILKHTKYKDFRTVCTQGHWMGMITEGVGFIIAVEAFMKDSNCKEYFTDKSFKWLKLLIKSIPFDQVHTDSHTDCIDLLFIEEAVIRNHLEAIKQKLYVKFRESLKFLDPCQFLVIEKYTKSRQITDNSIFMDYLKNCEIIAEQEDLVCSKSDCHKVIEAWILRTPPGKRSDILVFFEIVSRFYEKWNRPSDLFLDLIQLNDLLTSSTDSSLVETDEAAFHQFLQKKNKPNVSNAILKDLSTFIVLPTRDTTNSFQWLVCSVILEGLQNINIINSLTLVKRILWDVKSQFEVNTRNLTADLNTPCIRFACGVLQLFASKVDFKKESWATDSPVSILDLVTAIAPLFDKCHGCIVASPPEIEYCLLFFTDVCERFGDLLRYGSTTYCIQLEQLFKRQEALYKEGFVIDKFDGTKTHEIHQQVIKYTSTIESLEADIAHIKSQNTTLLNENNHLRKSLRENEYEKKNWEEERAGIDQQLRAYKRQADDLRRQLAEEKEKRQQLDIQNTAKFQEVEQMKYSHEKEIDRMRNSNSNLVKKIEDLQRTLVTVRSTEQELNLQIVQVRRDNQRIQETAQGTIDAHQQEIRRLRTKLENPHWVIHEKEIKMTQEILGKGGWGEVKVGVFRGTKVAVKSLFEVILSDYNRGLFSREMDIASRVRHPNLLQFIGATRDGNLMIVTELMPTSLRKELGKRPLKHPEILIIAQGVASALNYLHLWKPNPILHRDVSSANVLLEPSVSSEWKAKLSDYGSANILHQINTVAPGSPAYAAPEACSPDLHSPAMDVYSFGILFVEMVTHRMPSTVLFERVEQIEEVQWPPVKALVNQCTTRDPHTRPTMEQILKDINTLL